MGTDYDIKLLNGFRQAISSKNSYPESVIDILLAVSKNLCEIQYTN